jgi:signal transduction histidine kinase
VLFGVLAAYVLLQFLWWAYLLVDKENELRLLVGQLEALGVSSTHMPVDPGRTMLMVAGEGFVFVALLLFGLWLTYRSVRHELVLARAQRNFLLATSHELRTPIAAAKLHLQTLRRPQLDAGQREAMTQAALADVDRLASLSEKILLATRLDETGVPLHRERVDVGALLDELVRTARSTYGAAHDLQLERQPLPEWHGDADALRSIVGNLVENACKYAPPSTRVHVACAVREGRLELTVADEGPGVAPEERGRIFERFHRGGSEETRQVKGTGLGLFIVDKLARAMGGRAEHRPRAPHGSIFAVQIPLN